jgi:nicotinate-nucleotide adenylyltransferase
MKKDRIGIFGGTFNPIHLGHLAAAETVQKRFLLDRIFFVPSHIPPHKKLKNIASPLDRLHMVELAVAPNSRFIASSMEIDSRGKSYSINTLNRFKKIYPGAWIFFILGADAFLEIGTWKSWKKVLNRCLFLVVSRPGYHLRKAKAVLGSMFQEMMCTVSPSLETSDDLISSFKVFLLPINALPISSTAVRQRIKEGKSLWRWVPKPVDVYIKQKRLYR